MGRRVTVLLAVGWLGACGGQRGAERQEVEVPSFARLTAEDVAKLIPSSVEKRQAWAKDVVSVLEELDQGTAPATVCQVLAIIEQESGYKANPVVPGLAKLVQKRLDHYSEKLGPLGRPALAKLLEGKAPDVDQTFEERLKHVRTEKDLDLVFRDLLDFYSDKFPATFLLLNTVGGLFTRTHLEDLNPITTAGSMQVSVRFATELGEKQGLDSNEVRDKMYTRHGGVYFGTARLLGYQAAYSDPIFRFADYNAGMYASRNSALQAQVAEMTGVKLVTDGDLLAYSRVGVAQDTVTRTLKAFYTWRAHHAPSLTEARVRKDALWEKDARLEETDTWRAIKHSYQKLTGKPPVYAKMPEVTISSPKMSKDRSTSWYAKNVNIRYQACMKRHQSLRGPEA